MSSQVIVPPPAPNPVNIDPPILKDINQVTSFPDVEAQYVGGTQKLFEFIQNNIVYTKSAKENGIEGKVYVQFVIEKNGSVSNVEVARGIYKDLDDEAIRVTKSFPNWIPAVAAGKTVRSRIRIPISFIIKK